MSDDNPYTPPEADVTVEDSTGVVTRGSRLGASIIDGLLSLVVIFPTIYATGFWETLAAGEESLATTAGIGVFAFAVFVILHGYLLAKYGQTIGKRLVEIRIVSIHDGKILPFWKVISLRALPVFVIGQVPLVGPLLTIVDVLFIFRSDRRCVHDLIAGSKVITA